MSPTMQPSTLFSGLTEAIRASVYGYPPTTDPSDAFVYTEDGRKFWGLYGAAGILIFHPQRGVLLQHRAGWTHHGNTWSILGGARKQGESAREAALREASEEAGIPADALDVMFSSVHDEKVWTYTTFVARATRDIEAVAQEGEFSESNELAWVAVEDVEGLNLHPAFRESWAELKEGLLLLEPGKRRDEV